MYYLYEITWKDDEATGVQVSVGGDQRELSDGELLTCSDKLTSFVLSWQVPRKAEEESEEKAEKKPEKEPAKKPEKQKKKAVVREERAQEARSTRQKEKEAHASVLEDRLDAVVIIGESGAVTLEKETVCPCVVTLKATTTSALRGRYRLRIREVGRWKRPERQVDKAARWLVHPGGMSGDLWHIVGAMHFDQRLQLLLIWNRGDDKDDGRANALRGLIEQLGLDKRLITRSVTTPIDNDAARKIAPDKVPQGSLCGHTWASTFTIVSNAQAPGWNTETTVKSLRNLFEQAQKSSEEFKKFKSEFDNKCLSWLDNLPANSTWLLVNMRWVGMRGQNPQHNITPDRFASVMGLVETMRKNTNKTIRVVRIGLPEKASPEHFEWLGKYNNDTVGADIYCDQEPKSDLAAAITRNKLFQPYFWCQVIDRAQMKGATVLLFGGRSGGMDIASFMGLRSASWDRVNENDHHYMRLHWAAPFNTIVGDETHEGLDLAALERWLEGDDLVPILPSDPASGTVVGTLAQYGQEGNNQWFNALWFPPAS